MISPGELDDLVKSLQAVYQHIRTNRRHMDKIEEMAERLRERLEALLPEEPEEPEEVPEEISTETYVVENLDDKEVAEEDEG